MKNKFLVFIGAVKGIYKTIVDEYKYANRILTQFRNLKHFKNKRR